MKRPQTFSLMLILSSALLASNAFAQTPTSGPAQTPAAKPQTSSGDAASKPQSSTAAKKSGAATATKPGTAAAPVLKTNRDKASYAFGANLAKNLKQQNIDLDPALLARGFKDASGTGKPLLTEQEEQAALMAYAEEVRKKIETVNQKEGEAFLAANKVKPGITTLPSGLEYKVITAGTGPKPTAQDTVVCNYRGTLVNGKEFDNSARHGGPTEIPVSGVIKGWTEALQLMPVGSKWELYIPSDLAYGGRETGPIGPGSALVFEVELVSIKEKPKEEPKPAADPKDAAKPATPAPQSEPQKPVPQQPAPQPTPPPQPAPKPPSD